MRNTMKKNWSPKWKASAQKRKQKKYLAKMPLHTKKKLMRSAISAELKKKHGKNAVTVKTGDKVKILRGNNKGKSGKVEKVNYTKKMVYITGVGAAKKDGSQRLFGIHPSNLTITELDLNDKKREALLTKKA